MLYQNFFELKIIPMWLHWLYWQGYKSGSVHDSIAVSWWGLEMRESAIHARMLSAWCRHGTMAIPLSWVTGLHWVCTNIIIGVVSHCSVSQDICINDTFYQDTIDLAQCARCTLYNSAWQCESQSHLDCHPCHKTATWWHLPGQWSHVPARVPMCRMCDETDRNGHQMVSLRSQCQSN